MGRVEKLESLAGMVVVRMALRYGRKRGRGERTA